MPKRSENRDVELDYSPSSGAVGSEAKNYDSTAPSHDYGRSDKHTGFDPKEAPNDGVVERGGEMYNKWDWLERLNDGVWSNERIQKSQKANLRRDILVLSKHFSLVPRIVREAKSILLTVHEERGGGLRFGPTNPIEVSELAAISIASRKCIDVDDFTEIDPEKSLRHDAAFDGPTFTKLCGTWPPSSVDVGPEDVRHVRSEMMDVLDQR